MSKSGKMSSSACVMSALLPASSASLLTVSLMHGAQAGAMPSVQGPLTIKGAHAVLEVVSGKERESLSTFLGSNFGISRDDGFVLLELVTGSGSLSPECLAPALLCVLNAKRADLSLAQAQHGSKHRNVARRTTAHALGQLCELLLDMAEHNTNLAVAPRKLSRV